MNIKTSNKYKIIFKKIKLISSKFTNIINKKQY